MARRAPRDPGSPKPLQAAPAGTKFEDSVNAGLPAAARSVESSGEGPAVAYALMSTLPPRLGPRTERLAMFCCALSMMALID